MPLAPGRFSTTIVTPCARPICSAIRRATASVLAPGGTGTTSLMVRPDCAHAAWPDSASTEMAQQAANRFLMKAMAFPDREPGQRATSQRRVQGAATARLFLLQEERAFLADRGDEPLGQLGKQPRQGHLESQVILLHLDRAAGRLAQRPKPERQAVAVPDLFVDRHQMIEAGSRLTETGLEAARGLLFPEA